MFLTKMVNDFITTINNSNQQQSSEKPQQNSSRSSASNHKANKKSSKSKKSNTKSPYNAVETEQLPETSTKREIILGDHPKTISKTVTPTKVKSGSWKRSEKSIAPLNAFNANKKHKTLRKKSPNWLKFSSSKIKKQDWNQPVTGSESTSACRPGTLYSDVLFSAGCSNLVKIKNVTSVNNTSANAQKKLTKALFKFNGVQDNETSDDSEIEGKKKLFPALQKIKNKIYTPSLTNDNNNIINNNNNSEKATASVEKSANSGLLNTSTTSSLKNEMYEEPDVVVLSDFKGLSLIENNISYGKYLEQHFQQLNGKVKTEAAPCSEDKEFLISSISNIPKWNFMNVETGSSDAFPKFLCQFEDENYLKAEKMALLGLKLALGNYSPQNK